MKLMIIESPGKVQKLTSILGADYRIVASIGHVRDLPTDDIAVSAPDFRPTYVLSERGQSVVERIKHLVSSADEILLATDPDREGESISWHLKEVLGLKEPKRVTFYAITPDAVRAAVAAPRVIDVRLVAAEEARRVLDRLVGYMVSPEISRRYGSRLTAGLHPAVTPTHWDVTTAGETEAQRTLYGLIRTRAIASQLRDARYAVRVALLSVSADAKALKFEARGRTLVEPGWTSLLTEEDSDEDEEEPGNNVNLVPELSIGQELQVLGGKIALVQRFIDEGRITAPPGYPNVMSGADASKIIEKLFAQAKRKKTEPRKTRVLVTGRLMVSAKTSQLRADGSLRRPRQRHL